MVRRLYLHLFNVVRETVKGFTRSAGDCDTGSCKGCVVGLLGTAVSQRETKQAISELVHLGHIKHPSELRSFFGNDQDVKPALGCQHKVSDLSMVCMVTGNLSDKSACGIGVSTTNQPSSQFVQAAMDHLKKDRSRGSGANQLGDGVGFLAQLDNGFFLKRANEFKKTDGSQLFESMGCLNAAIDQDTWGLCQVFSTPDPDVLNKIRAQLIKEGLRVHGIRKVPMDLSKFHRHDAQHIPVYQFLVSHPSKQVFDQCTSRIQNTPSLILQNPENLCSISDLYVNYKLSGYGTEIDVFTDTQRDQGYKSNFMLTHVRFSTTTLAEPGKAHPHQRLIHNGEILSKGAMIRFMHRIQRELAQVSIHLDLEELKSASDSAVLNRYISALHQWLNWMYFDQLSSPFLVAISQSLQESDRSFDEITVINDTVKRFLQSNYQSTLSMASGEDICRAVFSDLYSDYYDRGWIESTITQEAFVASCIERFKDLANFSISEATVIQMICRSERGDDSLNRFAASMDIPSLVGPCNFAFHTRINGKEAIVFSCDDMGYRPASVRKSPDGVQISSAQYCQDPQPEHVEEGAILILYPESANLTPYNCSKLDPRFRSVVGNHVKAITSLHDLVSAKD